MVYFPTERSIPSGLACRHTSPEGDSLGSRLGSRIRNLLLMNDALLHFYDLSLPFGGTWHGWVGALQIFSLARMAGSTGEAREARAHKRDMRPRRSKVFTGCLTCRSRHLKCDEKRPTCQRCSDAQLKCAGYHGYRAGVRWVSVEGPANFRSEGPTVLENSTPPFEHEAIVSFSETTAVVARPTRTESPLAECIIQSPSVDENETILGADLLLQDADEDPGQRCHNNTPTDGD